MTIQECYENLNSNYNDVANRFAGSKALVLKFAKKFCDDPGYQLLADSMAEKDYKDSERAVSESSVYLCDTFTFHYSVIGAGGTDCFGYNSR